MNHLEEKKKKVFWPWLAAPVSGVLLAMCFPGWNLSGLIWVWMLPLLPAIWRGEKKRYGFAIGYLSGLAFWLLNLKWLWEVSGLGAMALGAFLALYSGAWGVIAVSVGNPWKTRRVKMKGLSSGGGGIQNAINKKLAGKQQAGFLGGALTDSFSSLKFAGVNAAAWVGLEWLRGWLFTGFGWNGLGVAFHDTPVLAQGADLVGVTGLAFTPVFFSAVLIQTGRRLMREAKTGKLKPRLDFGVAALLLAVQFCYGVWRLKEVRDWEMERVRILLVQQNIPQDLKWDPSEGAAIIQGYADATTQAIEALERSADKQMREHPEKVLEIQTPDLVIWPESAMPAPLYFADDLEGYLVVDSVQHMLDHEVRPLGNFTLIAGMNEVEADWDGHRASQKIGGSIYNSMVAIAPEEQLGTSIQSYRKLHLVIFGEYIPLVDQLPWLKKMFEFSAGASFSGNFQAGESTDPLTVPLLDGKIELIPSVCFEDTVGRLTRKFVRPAPQLIINVTNDGWFKESEASAQHIANARFRAIELRRPMVRAANTGVSGIISVSGSLYDPVSGERQVIENEAGSHFTKDTLYGSAYTPKHGPITLYALAGDWFAWLMMVWVFMSIVKITIRPPESLPFEGEN